jgi:hypothetical protein
VSNSTETSDLKLGKAIGCLEMVVVQLKKVGLAASAGVVEKILKEIK